MAPTGRDPGESTMIRVSSEVKQLIEDTKIIPREPLNDCIHRVFIKYHIFTATGETAQTREKMEKDMSNYVLNPDVPDSRNPRIIWAINHPNDPLSAQDLIHHINGNHDDNRPENLEKVDEVTHKRRHSDMRKKQQATESQNIPQTGLSQSHNQNYL